ncbi:tripartite tricarboxylate transporter TctB family protein [Niallia oryzisoli]|uniref:Tripartite tricarboxylate transporter TctB family protein n=1 Tax=Niallia oryzisoli TaxID=1737571 RepID=A0ABZ2CD84_9BACI
MVRNKGEMGAGIFLFLFSSVFFVQALGYEYSGSLGPGPGFFSSWISGGLAVLSLIYIYQTYKKGKTAEKEEDEDTPKNHSFGVIAYTLGCMLFYVLALNYLGFVLTTTIFLFALLFKEYKWYTSLGIAIFASILIFWLFGVILKVALPLNVFGW